MANPNAQFPAQNIVTDQGVYPFSALLEVIKRLIAALFGAGASTVVWRPGGVSSGNVFATWAEVVAAVAKMNGDVTIALDASIAPAVIPAGAWDLRPAGVNGPVEIVNGTKSGAGITPFITIANAPVTIHGLSGIDEISIDNQSTSNVIAPAAATTIAFYMRGSAAIYQNVLSAGAAFFFATPGAQIDLFMQDYSFISTLDTGVNALQTGANPASFLELHIQDLAALDTNQLSGSRALVLVSAASGILGVPAFATQAASTNVPDGLRVSGSSPIVVGTGKTAAIPAFITAQSRILVSLKTPVGDALTIKYAALAADRVNGVPGSFQISALAAAGGGAVNGADTSTIDWEVFTP